MLSLTVILALAGLILTLFSAVGKVQLWIPVLLAFIIFLLAVIPR